MTLSTPLPPPSSCISDFSHTTFLVTCFSAGGLGDLACGAHIVQFLKEMHIPEDHILFCTRNPSEMIPFHSLIGRCRVLMKEEALSIHNVGMHIIAPVPVSSFMPDYLATGKPILTIREYGKPPFPHPLIPSSCWQSTSFGLQKERGELGIFIDKDLDTWARSSDAQDPHRKAETLFQNPFLASELLGEEKSPDHFAATTMFYFGYASKTESIIAFLLALDEMNRESSKDILLVVPRQDPQKLFSNLQSWKHELHVGSVFLRTYFAEHPFSRRFQAQREVSKKLTIITGSFSLEDIRCFLMSSERETIATGDQSLGLALSAHKNFVYEALPHKEEFIRELIPLFGQEAIAQISPSGYMDIQGQKDLFLRSFLRHRKDAYQQLSKLCSTIATEGDCQASLKGTIETLLASWRTAQIERSPPLTFLHRDPSSAFFTKIPFDRPTVLTTDQYSQLYIDERTHLSPLLPDSVFEEEDNHIGYSVIIRHKRADT